MNKEFAKQLLKNFDLHKEAEKKFPDTDIQKHGSTSQLFSAIDNSLSTTDIPEDLQNPEQASHIITNSKTYLVKI